MIGNNACGSRALGYGRTVDNVLGLRRADRGRGRGCDSAPATASGVPTLDAPARAGRARTSRTIRTEFGRFGRQVSGYALEHLLPENGFDVARVAGRQRGHARGGHRGHGAAGRRARAPGTGGARLPATSPPAADAAPAVLAHRPIACEGIDSRIVDVRAGTPWAAAGSAAAARGGAGCSSSSTGDDPGDAVARAEALGATRRARVAGGHRHRHRPPRCGGSGPTAPGWPAVAPPGCPRTPAGRTPRCHRAGWVTTCATSTP